MHTWWFFRETRTEEIDEQREKAEKYVPNHLFWLGNEKTAAFKDCKDITALIYGDKERELGFPSADRPIKESDKVYVANLFVLGGNIPKIRSALQKLHSRHIQLVIPSIGYDDNGETNDFDLLNGTLGQIYRYRQSAPVLKKGGTGQEKEPGKAGRSRRNVHIELLSTSARKIVHDYCYGTVSEREALKKLKGKMPDGGKATDYIFRRLAAEYREKFMKR